LESSLVTSKMSPLMFGVNARHGAYYGWWVLAVAFTGEMLAVGSTNYSYGLFVKPLSEEFGLDRASANSGLTLFIVGRGLGAPLVGGLLDRFPARVVMSLGALLMGAGMAGIALSPSLLGMALCLLPVSLGSVAIGPLAASTLAARWFDRSRGLALGIVAVGTSVGGTTMVPLIGFEMQHFGWRIALLIQAALIAGVIGSLAWSVVRSRPQDLDVLPFGDLSTPASFAPADAEGWTARPAFRQSDFWCINVAVALMLAILESTLVSLVPYATDRGFGLAQAQWMVSCFAASSIIGKLSFGAMADRVDKRWLLLVAIGAVMIEQTTLLLAPGYRALLLIGGVAGFASGAILPVWGALIAERFGARSFGSVMGLMNALNISAIVIAIPFIGRVYDRTGNYALAFQVFLCVALVAAVATLLIAPPPGLRNSLQA
jgi:MFS family permease